MTDFRHGDNPQPFTDLARARNMTDDDRWYEAFANKAHELVPDWDPSVDLTPLQEHMCECHADSVAPRPEAER